MPDEIRSTSPDGRFSIRIYAWEARMSHWIETPELFVTATNESLLRFQDSNWSLDEAVWSADNLVTLDMRKYPGDHTPPSVKVTVDCANRTASIAGHPVNLDQIESALNASIRRR